MKHRQMSDFIQHLALIGLGIATFMPVLALAGCDRQEIHSYRVAKELETKEQSDFNTGMPDPAASQVSWTPPTSWQEVETTVSMRIATYNASNGLEIAVTAFPGDVGGLLANVNRWRGQVGLSPVNQDSLIDSISQIEGKNILIIDLAGANQRLVGSIIGVGDGKTWFVKTVGAAEEVELVKEDLISFSKTFHIHHPGDVHGDTPTETDTSSAQPPSNTNTSTWEQPAQWTVQEDVSSMLTAAFMADSGARITLTLLGGEGGGMLSNINRWRGQLGLGIVRSLADQPKEDLGNGAVFVDLVSNDESGRMAAGIVPIGGRTLFFKLTGNSEQVGAELQRFKDYINHEGLGKAGTP